MYVCMNIYEYRYSDYIYIVYMNNYEYRDCI